MSLLIRTLCVIKSSGWPAVCFVSKRQFPAVPRKMEQPASTAAEPVSSAAEPNESPIPIIPDVNYMYVPFGKSSSRVGFVDVGRREGPVVVLLHGAPGGVKDFAELYGPLTEKGIRLVVPEFPGYGNTTMEEGEYFDESTEARATLVHNFLNTLCIKSVTTVIGHSMGVVASFHLAANYNYFKSVIYLNGIGFKPSRGISPYFLTCMYARLLENSWTEPVVKNVLSWAYWWRGYNTKAIDSGMKIGVVAAARIGFDQFRVNASRLKDKRLPVFFAFTQNDRLIQWQIPMEIVQHFDTPDESISWVDSNKQVVKGPKLDDVSVSFPWAMIFERGGHFLHRSHQPIIVNRISSFVERVHKSAESQL